MAVDDDSSDLDVQDFRLWWEQGQLRPTNDGDLKVWKLAATLVVIVALAAIVVFAPGEHGPSPPKGPPAAAALDDHRAPGPAPGDATTTAPDGGKPAAAAPSHPSAQSASPSARSADPRPVRTAAVRPDGALIATPASIEASARKPPGWSAAAAIADGPAPERPPRPDARTKTPPPRPPSRAVVATRETAGPAAVEPTPETPVRPVSATMAGPVAAQPATDTIPASFDRMLHTLGGLIGANTAPVGQSGSAPAMTDWAVQLASVKTETEARTRLARLSVRHAAALEGARIGVRKADVDGVTVYRLRVVDLSRADASGLCARLKEDGGDCLVVR
ncbi:sporulation related protein [Roseiarcus fermentans]|uniref:Sporulation related protein n=1 Tax=Roseiarcus fermentans TaxID=1473586 RepID=A0A366FW44_9HYPH|nr:SPOR domain-containing protein [Roseiarcus fermentans]RBP18366.1 sporulation related protein [Roseiarcus fermentans]